MNDVYCLDLNTFVWRRWVACSLERKGLPPVQVCRQYAPRSANLLLRHPQAANI